MSFQSVNLLRERVIRAAKACVAELEEREAMVHTKATRELVRAVKALEQETWRQDEAPAIIEELLYLVKLLPGAESSILAAKVRDGTQEGVLRAKAFLGQREVNDDTTPKPPKRKLARS
jgi:hypothetical protein